MRKLETLSDTVFEQSLSEILSSDTETEKDSQKSTQRCRITFPDTFPKNKKHPLFTELFIRIIAGVAALILFIFFVLNIYSKF